MTDLYLDTLRVVHMLCFAVGIGSATFLELQVLRRFRSGVEIEGLRLLLNGHEIIKWALIGLWMSGLGLLFMRLGVMGGEASAKLVAKLIVVSLLTANMIVIDRILIPEIFEYEGARINEIPGAQRAQFGGIAGFSAGCWASALFLGGFGRFKMMDGWEIASILVPILLTATLFGVMFARVAGAQQERRSALRAAVAGE